MTLKGNTGDFPLDVVLRLLTETKKTGELTLRGEKGDGALGLSEGRVIAAVYGDEAPIPALGSIWELGRVDFEFTPWNDAPPGNLEGELQDNLRKADEYKKWIESVRQVIPTDRTRFRLSERAAEQGAVTFTSDRWRVVLAVNAQRDVNALAAHLKVDRDTALTTLAGLVRDGVIETVEPAEETQAPPAPSPPRAETTFAPPPREEAIFAPPPREEPTPAPPPPSEPAPQARPPSEPEMKASPPPPAAASSGESTDWTARLLERRAQQGGSSTYSPTPDWAPPTPVPDRPTWSAPPPAPGTEEWTPPEPIVPQPQTPAYDASADTWTPPMPTAEPPRWTAPAETPETQWTPPAAQPEAPQWTAPAIDSSQEWTPPAPAEPVPVEPEDRASAAPPATPDWATNSAEPATPQLDDRLAALEGLFNTPPTEAPAPAQSPTTIPEWSRPALTPEWSAPAPEAVEMPADDPRLSALTAPPPAPAVAPMPAAKPQMPPGEWAPPPPSDARPAEKKKGGLFGGLFGGAKREEPSSASHGPGPMESGASSRAGQLAAFSNALLSEYNSGQYGKTKVDDRIPSLLMRVDEQADPIDKPLPVVDDRLDVQALERVGLPEGQAVPYLAMLVSTIYADAEKAFGKDKAKRGYKVAQQLVFRGDTSALSGLSGKLPKV
jgi:uncharacterized protein DUF4388